MKKTTKILWICATVLLGLIYTLINAFVESALTKTIVALICSTLVIAIYIVLCVDAVKQIDKDKQNDNLIERQKKWKKTAIITFTINLILLCVNFVLPTVRESINSTAASVLSTICGGLETADLVVLFISAYKLCRLNILMEKREEDSSNEDISDNDNKAEQ